MDAMKTLVLAILSVISLSAHGSQPITGDESQACVSGGTPERAGQLHSVLLGKEPELMDVLNPNIIAYAVLLNPSEQHSAVFKVDGLTTQTIEFNFNRFPGRDVCFRYDNTKRIWTISETPKNMCRDCSADSHGS